MRDATIKQRLSDSNAWIAVRHHVPMRESRPESRWQPERRQKPRSIATTWNKETTATTIANNIANNNPDLLVRLIAYIIDDYLRAHVSAERHMERHDDESVSIEWIARRRRLILHVRRDLSATWSVANLTVQPWRESSGYIGDIRHASDDMGRAVSNFIA